MIPKSDRNILIGYRLNQAKETIEEVNKLIETGLLKVAVNRVYYGMFYCLTALALKYEFNSSKHAQLIGWFNKDFIKTGLIDIRYGQILRDAFKNRTEGDYSPFIEFELADVIEMRDDLKESVMELEAFIGKRIP